MGKNFRSPSQATTSGSISSYTGLTRSQMCRKKTKRRCKNFGVFLYNKENKTFCNRTCLSWLLIILFYGLFISLLVGTCFAAVIGIMCYIKSNMTAPYFDKRFIVENGSPGVNILPKLDGSLAPIIWYTHKGPFDENNINAKVYINNIDNLLKRYENLNKSVYIDCLGRNRQKGQYCMFNKESLGPCGKYGYGYDDDKPCIYVKLNKLKQWIPESYTSVMELPDIMTTSMAREILRFEKDKDGLWIECDGLTPFDKEHMGTLKYYPYQGFPKYYFPYHGGKGYLPPLVGVQFMNIDPGYVIAVRCWLWGKNVNLEEPFYHSTTVFMYVDIKRE